MVSMEDSLLVTVQSTDLLKDGRVTGVESPMFVVSGHLYRPLPLSQPCGLKVKIKDGFGTRLQCF